jgi:ribonuclease Z
LATIRWVNGNNTEPLDVIGPDGVHKVVEGFNQAYQQDSVYRNEHHGDAVAPPSGFGLTAKPFRLPVEGVLETVYDNGDLTIRALAVDHAPVSPAVGYLFNYRDRSLLVSGDTSKSANIEKFSEGVDLLVHEALSADMLMIMHEAAKRTGNEGMAKITIDVLNYHATPVEAAETARDADVGHLLYYHIVPPLIFPGAEAAWLEGVDEVFPDYTLGQDGTAISLPSGSTEITVTSQGM